MTVGSKITFKSCLSAQHIFRAPSSHVTDEIYRRSKFEMYQEISSMDEVLYPILFLPKKCTNLETNCEVADNVYIDVKITSPDTEGNNACIYTGFCNIKLVDQYDVNIQASENTSEETLSEVEHLPMIISDQQQPMYSQSQVWIDPARSPHVYNSYDVTQSRECYSVCHQSSTSIMVEQRNMYITKNVYNYKEAVHYSTHEECNQKSNIVKQPEQPQEKTSYENDEFECGVFLSQLPEEIMNEKQNKDREERKYIGLQSENSALKQLMSSDIQSMSRQRKTILFLGPDSQCGHTIQQIGYYDPSVECCGGPGVDNEVVIEDAEPSRQKRYQCLQCHQIFDQISDYRDHMVNHKSPKYPKYNHLRKYRSSQIQFMCTECGKYMKTRDKFEKHCLAHGNPDLECDKCHKVFASKFTLRNHKRIHYRKHRCPYCPYKTFSNEEDMRLHATKAHFLYKCEVCDYVSDTYTELVDHTKKHETQIKDSSDNELGESISMFDDVMSDRDDTESPDPDWKVEQKDDDLVKYEEIRKADSVIAKVMSNKMFLGSKPKKNKRCSKVCDVCYKSFDRISDLKRHLIEHVVRSTLKKTPVNSSGSLTIVCEVCQVAVFTEIDRYKAHLREHAKLTLYKCTFCNKCFSDSSNFSKHKKIHGAPYFQCDLCQRKFNSKKMITQHMEYHNKNKPLECMYCEKVFHFESMLNKHIKFAHTRQTSCRFRCRFCYDYFKTLKEKWDHEWTVHNVRKMIVDCLICDAKFRKYAELKRHCADEHKVEIPTAKKLLRKRSF